MNNINQLAKEALIQAREKISSEKHWCQKKYATDADGMDVSSTSPQADRWCARGALLSLNLLDEVYVQAIALLQTKAQDCYDITVAEVNDECSHESVMYCYDKAIAWADTNPNVNDYSDIMFYDEIDAYPRPGEE